VENLWKSANDFGKRNSAVFIHHRPQASIMVARGKVENNLLNVVKKVLSIFGNPISL
jgi:hypothetical protein